MRYRTGTADIWEIGAPRAVGDPAGILRVTGETDTAKAFAKIMGLVMPVSNDMTDFFLYLMRGIVTRHLGEKILSFRTGTGTMFPSAPNL